MILDSSAILALALEDPEYEKILEKLGKEAPIGIGSPTLVETGIVLEARLGVHATDFLVNFLEDFQVSVISFGSAHWRRALLAFRRFGKGRHPAALNFGDCMSYAVAAVAGEPLLCIGEDFPKTDLELA